MMFEIHRSRFLKASALLQELIVLEQIQGGNARGRGGLANTDMTEAVVQEVLGRLERGAWVARDGDGALRLTAAGEQQLRVLTVDYMRELVLLHGEMIGVFRKKLAEFYFSGVRRVAFYPVGDTAEVAYLALPTTGLTLELAVDDDPLLWGAKFHECAVASPKALATAPIDAVVLTTSVFESAIRRRLDAMPAIRAKVLSLW